MVNNSKSDNSKVYPPIETDKRRGLTQADAALRLEYFGSNSLPTGKRDTYFLLFIRQFKSPLIFILVIAGVLMSILGTQADAISVVLVVIANAFIGAYQEGRAGAALETLQRYTKTDATVIRDGQTHIIDSSEVVPSDIIVLQEGEQVPADADILESQNLTVNEAALTGESEPIHKFERSKEYSDLRLAKVFKGTLIVAGHGLARVLATGSYTEIGKVSKSMLGVSMEMPLMVELRRLTRSILYVISGSAILLFVVGILLEHSVLEMFFFTVAIAVATIPEGLPIVFTIVLALSVARMAKKNALVKRLQAVEGLGEVDIIAVDKTGTLTRNEMMVTTAIIGKDQFIVSGNGYEPNGEVQLNNQSVQLNPPEDLDLLGAITALSGSARTSYDEKSEVWKVSGDPTEAALIIFGKKIGHDQSQLEQLKVIAEQPFSSDRKYRAMIIEYKTTRYCALVGAPEVVLDLSQDAKREKNLLEKQYLQFSRRGLRMVSVSLARTDSLTITDRVLRATSHFAFIGMHDPLRADAASAIAESNYYGIGIKMITGDHPETAKAIALEAGLMKHGDQILTGSIIAKLSPSELKKRVREVSVFARVTPNQKLDIIRAIQANGLRVAMTGDGVNDAPALLAADLGVAMGKIGTEVAKDASDLVILDDKLQTIVVAIREGRAIKRSLQRVTLYLLSTNAGEILIAIACLALNLPLPFTASQILWLNVVTDSFLDIALGIRVTEQGLEEKRLVREHILPPGSLIKIALMAGLMALGSIYVYIWGLKSAPLQAATLTLTTLAAYQWWNAWNLRNDRASFFNFEGRKELPLLAATAIVVVLQLFAVYSPFMQNYLQTLPLSKYNWFIAVMISFSLPILHEFIRHFPKVRWSQSNS